MQIEKGINIKLQKKISNEEFNRLVLEHHGKIYGLFIGMVKTHEDADDLTQETFIKVHKNFSKFKGDSSIYTWIYRIAVNNGLNYIKKMKRRQYIGLENIDIKSEEKHSNISNHSKKILKKVILKLSAKQQMIIILRSFQELSYREISAIMNISENSAKVNFSHAIKNLKMKFEKMGVSYESL